jgi:DNA-binding GntR family transcriptional regulator
MAARLAARRASKAEIAQLRSRFLQFSSSQAKRGPQLAQGSAAPEGDVATDAAADRSEAAATGSEGDVAAPDTQPPIAIDEYSELNVAFHQRIVDLARSELFSQEVARLQVHMRAIRHSTMGDSGRLSRSVVDHTHIVEALEARDADLVERHVRQHALDLAEHVRLHRHDLD